jgi:hypothetical protein
MAIVQPQSRKVAGTENKSWDNGGWSESAIKRGGRRNKATNVNWTESSGINALQPASACKLVKLFIKGAIYRHCIGGIDHIS